MSEILARAADNTTDSSVPSPATEFMKYDPLIRNELRQTYNEAGKVLAAASKSVEAVIDLNLNNADILGSFQTNVAENMAPTYFTDDSDGKRYDAVLSRSGDNFKSGDAWEHNNILYTAIQNSSNVQYETDEDALTSIKGWAVTKNGQLAISNISGAYLTIDTEKGEIEIAAQKQVQLICGGEINLYSKDVVITGEEDVIIGGPNVTIYSTDTNGDNTKGVHIFASQYSSDSNASSLSAVDITGDGVVIGSAGKIDIKSAEGINIYSSDTSSTSAIRINREQGIYLGSNQPIRLFSGTSVPSSGITNASVEISNSRILFGVTNGQKGNAVDITKDYIIFGSSFINSNGEETTTNIGSSTGGAGVKITQTSIQMATGTANTNTRNYISMDSSGIIIANANNETNGSYVKVSKDGVLIGANTTTQQQNLINDITGTSHNISYSGARFQVYAPNFCVNSSGTLYAYNANISGTIRATAGRIGGWTIGSDYITTDTKRTTYDSSNSGMTLSAGGIGARSSSTQYFTLSSTGILKAYNATISGNITAKNGTFGDGAYNITIGTSTVGNLKYGNIHSDNKDSLTSQYSGFYLGANGLAIGAYNSTIKHNPFEVDTLGKLYAKGAIIEGNITATGGEIGGWTIGKTPQNHSYITTSPSRTEYNSSSEGMTLDANGIGAYKDDTQYFTLSTTGILTAYNANINGTINSENGKIGGWYIGSNYIGNKDSFNSSTIGLYNKLNNDSDDGMNIVLPDEIDIDITDDGNGEINWGGDGDIITNNTSNNKTTETYITLWAGSQEKQNANFRVYANGSVNAGNLYAKSGKLTGNLIVENSLGLKGRLRLGYGSDWRIIFDEDSYYTNLYNITLRNGTCFSIRHGSSDRFVFYSDKLTIRYDNDNQINLSSGGISITGDVTISKDLDVSGKIKINGNEIRQFPSNGRTYTYSNIVDMNTFSIDFDKKKWSWKAYKLAFKDGLLT